MTFGGYRSALVSRSHLPKKSDVCGVWSGEECLSSEASWFYWRCSSSRSLRRQPITAQVWTYGLTYIVYYQHLSFCGVAWSAAAPAPRFQDTVLGVAWVKSWGNDELSLCRCSPSFINDLYSPNKWQTFVKEKQQKRLNLTKKSCRRAAATICPRPAPLLPLWAPKRLAPPSRADRARRVQNAT